MRMDRRKFLKLSASATALLSLGVTPAIAETRNGIPYRVLGKTGEKVSLLCVGGHHMGRRQLTERDSILLMRTAIDEGINFFDNAWDYNGGRSEERMGKALRDGYRDKVFLMTKHHGREPKTAQQHLEDSLRRFRTDVIDLWQFHEIQTPEEPEEIYSSGALDVALKAKAEGKIRYIGFTGHRRPALLLDMIKRGFEWDTVQMPINVLDHHFMSFTQEVLPVANEKNIGVIAMKTQAAGAIPRAGAATPEECLRFAMTMPVSTVCSGMDSVKMLRENIATAKSFKPMEERELASLLDRTEKYVEEGRHEGYKTE